MSFKKVRLLRGFTEIQEFFALAEKHQAVICGGYARYCASPRKEPVKAGDVDFFPKTEDGVAGMQKDLEEMGFELRHENHVSITMRPKPCEEEKLAYLPTPQIIKPVVEGKIVTLGSVEEILENFDFTIVRAAIISSTEVLVDEEFMVDEAKMILRLRNIHCPVSSLLRCCKYARKGYFMRPGETLKLFNDWTDRGDDYKLRLLDLFKKSADGEFSEDNPGGMTREEIDELEGLLRID